MNEKMKTLHEKALRLVEGGIVEISGLSVKMGREHYIFDPCFVCEMDCLCHKDNDFADVCEECDTITGEDCYLFLVGSH